MAIYFGQTIDEKLTQADAYYDERSIYKHDWNKLRSWGKEYERKNPNGKFHIETDSEER